MFHSFLYMFLALKNESFFLAYLTFCQVAPSIRTPVFTNPASVDHYYHPEVFAILQRLIGHHHSSKWRIKEMQDEEQEENLNRS